MADNLLTALVADPASAAAPPPPAGARPSQVPDKFWDAQTKAIRVDALLKSYLELERKLSALAGDGAVADPADRARLLKRLGHPEQADQYQIACDHGLFTPDPEINQRLHAGGFLPDQAQLVYDLAAERFVPMIHQIAADFEAERQLQRLVEHFGGEAKWREVSRQILAWGKKNLPPAALDGLSTTAEGILALHRLMQSGEPVALSRAGESPGASEGDLQALMRDPRYWRDRHPEIVAKVTEGFRQLYPDRR